MFFSSTIMVLLLVFLRSVRILKYALPTESVNKWVSELNATQRANPKTSNPSVSSFMICVNELSDLKCHKKAILEKLIVILSPYAPHITEELWQILGNTDSVTTQEFSVFDAKHLIEDSFEYPIQINGKVRVTLNFPADMPIADIEKLVMSNDLVLKWLEGTKPKKIIVVPKRIVNVVI